MGVSALERVVEVAVCMLAAQPLARHLATRLRSGDRRRLTIGAGMLVALLAIAVGVSAFRFSPVLRGLAGLGLVVIGHRLWRARSSFGSARGLPPGSLAPAPAAVGRSQDYWLEQNAAHGPVFKACPAFRNPHVGVVGHEIALDALKAGGENLRPVPAAYNDSIPKGFLRYMDAVDHRHYRQVIRSAMPPGLVTASEDETRATIAADLKRWPRGRQGSVGPGEPVEPAITATMFTAMARLFFGIDADDQRFDQVQLHYRELTEDGLNQRSRRTEPALLALEDLLFEPSRRPVAERSPESILRRICDEDSSTIEDPTVRRNLIFMLATSHRDVAGMLTWVLRLLADNRSWVDGLRTAVASATPAVDTKGKSLADRVVMETLRLERSEYLYRRVHDDMRIGSFTIPAGWILRICVREGHRTNPVFDQPNAFDPDRFLDRSYKRTEYAPFGLWQRQCLGNDMAVDLGRIFLEEFFGSYDFVVVDDGPPEFVSGHWHPSPAFTIRMVEMQS